MAVAIDTNVIVRWLMRDDETLTARADGLIASAVSGSILLDRMILAELSYVLRSNYKLTKTEIIANLQALVIQPCFSLVDKQLTQAMIDHFAHHSMLSMEDAWLLAMYTKRYVDDVLTFDEPLKKRLSTNTRV